MRDGIVALLLPLIILGGILGGFCTATEAAALACAYALFLVFVFYRNLTLKEFRDILWSTSKTVGNIFMIGNCHNLLHDFATMDSGSFRSAYEAVEATAQADIDRLNDLFEKLA